MNPRQQEKEAKIQKDEREGEEKGPFLNCHLAPETKQNIE